jgi:hypothetical protein
MPNQPIFSILHTSVRPDKWEEIYRAWLDNAHDPDSVEYVLVCDHDWGFEELPNFVNERYGTGLDKATWARGPRHCYVDGVNLAANVSTGKILVVNADDQYPCKGWDKELLKVLTPAGQPELLDAVVAGDFIVLPSTGTKDEHIRKIAVMPIVSRTRYQKLGHVLFPLYESMFADNDFLAHARVDKVVIEAKHLLFPHRHPFNEGVPADQWDDAYKAQNRTQAFQMGYSIFEARQAMKFGNIPLVPTAVDTDKVVAGTNNGRPTIAFCLPGESYSFEWVTQWTEILCQLMPHYNITPLFCYSTNVYTTRESLFQAAVASKPDYIVWIDDDNLVAPGQVQKLLDGLNDNPGIDVISGWCWLRSNAYDITDKVSCGWWDGVKARVFSHYEAFGKGDNDLCSVGWTGFPIVAMRGSIAEFLPTHPFLPILSNDYPYGHSGEDVAFCRQEHGLSIFVDRTVKVTHLKRKPDEPATVVSAPVGANELAPA